jgi:hypothetical protein
MCLWFQLYWLPGMSMETKKTDIVCLFPSLNSIWIYLSDHTWKKISEQINVSDLRVGDINGDCYGEILGSWDSGVWSFDFMANQWTRHHGDQAFQICLGDLNNQMQQDIVGYWNLSQPLFVKYMETNTWEKLSNQQLITIDAGKVK